jgi:hypothetical protein
MNSAEIKERPIPFSAPMVLALHRTTNPKTQTRRIVKPQPPVTVLNPTMVSRDSAAPSGYSFVSDEYGEILLTCPYGKPGERLWVREQWRIGAWLAPDPGSRCWAGHLAVDYLADNFARREWLTVMDTEMYNRMEAQSIADAERAGAQRDARDLFSWEPGTSPCRKRQARFMPRWASRTLLDVVALRIERLQDISEADAIAEGMQQLGNCTPPNYDRNAKQFFNGISLGHKTAVEAFRALWESINGPGSWDANPWVWVVEFKRITP